MLDFGGVLSWKLTYLAVGKRKIIDSKKCVKICPGRYNFWNVFYPFDQKKFWTNICVHLLNKGYTDSEVLRGKGIVDLPHLDEWYCPKNDLTLQVTNETWSETNEFAALFKPEIWGFHFCSSVGCRSVRQRRMLRSYHCDMAETVCWIDSAG